MKKLTASIILLAITICIGATYDDYGPPFRKVNGKRVDFSEALRAFQSPAKTDADNRRKEIYMDWLVGGDVQSTGKYGILLDRGGKVVLLKNFPRQVLDGDGIVTIAMPVGQFKYKTVLGAEATVAAFDYGIPEKQQYLQPEGF